MAPFAISSESTELRSLLPENKIDNYFKTVLSYIAMYSKVMVVT